MKYVDEFRDPQLITKAAEEIRRLADPGRHYRLMEVCGGHTHAIYRFGLKDVNDLPSMEEFEKMAGELAESEAEGEVQDAGMRSSEEPGSLPAAEASEQAAAEEQEVTSPSDASESSAIASHEG